MKTLIKHSNSSFNVVYVYREREYENVLGKALHAGCKTFNDNFGMMLLPDTVEEFTEKIQPYDVVIFFGCAGLIPKCYRKTQELSINTIYCDKGYSRDKSGSGLITEYVRISCNEFQPLTFVKSEKCSEERFARLRINVKKTKANGKHIIVAGGSQKYADFHNLGDANTWAENIIKELKKYTDRPIYYRPKPSFKGGKPIAGSYFSGPQQSLEKLLENCYTLITWGSNAALEASYNGCPTLVLGDAIVHCISTHKIEDINNPIIPDIQTKLQLYRNISFCQWTHQEIKSGQMWEHIRKQFNGKNIGHLYNI